jgi:hypothetical protein
VGGELGFLEMRHGRAREGDRDVKRINMANAFLVAFAFLG